MGFALAAMLGGKADGFGLIYFVINWMRNIFTLIGINLVTSMWCAMSSDWIITITTIITCAVENTDCNVC